MIIRQRRRWAAVVAAGALVLAACGGDDDEAADTTTGAAITEAPDATTAPETTAPSGDTSEAPPETDGTEPPAEPSGWTVDTEACADPEAAEAAIEGTIKIGTVQPLSGTPAVAFAPVTDGFKAYVDYANANDLVPGYTLELSVEDDQYNSAATPGAVEKLVQDGVHLFSGIIGTPNNAAVRDSLNEECIPQLSALTGSPDWGEVSDYPWTTGQLVPYNTESRIYAAKIGELFPDGATVAIFNVNNEFGQVYVDTFEEVAGDFGIEIVDQQTIEATDANPPTSQVTSIASKAPDVIMAVPLGAQCPTFLKEVVNAKAANSGWEPAVFLTNTCSSKLFLSALAGDAGDGVYTSSNIKDPSDPANASDPGIAEFLATYASAGLKNDPLVTAQGWETGETLVAILNKALESGSITRKSIIEAARNLEFTPTVNRDGGVYKMNGEDDPFAFESLTVLQWSHANQTFTDIGDPVTEYETS